MGGIYGNTTLHFPEQNRTVQYQTADPLINSGYENVSEPFFIRVKIHNMASGYKDSNGNIVRYSIQRMFYEKKLEPGFIKFNDEYYRVIVDNDWPTQGGFYEYNLEKLVGANLSIESPVENFKVDGSKF